MNQEYEKLKLNTLILNHKFINLIPNHNHMLIELTESPSTGYCWHHTISDSSVVSLEEKEVFDFNKPNIIGGSLQVIWIFRCLKLGECKIHFSYYNSWKSDPFPIDEYIYIVKVE
ncbi:protease inhibitor I42 family protein [Clostridium sp. CS001]|uniref:protease inhibitor I42 family protein n=1 Tax=Clostridium sp. CS001 TaxID=2880648 RepID=UPI001CF582B0|nr:protease inhibitor I42 family protein [Clostridium sp. CS001]MCB2290384.1 protease inhibitor I42 family protein [Clostridium sp. CS001]